MVDLVGVEPTSATHSYKSIYNHSLYKLKTTLSNNELTRAILFDIAKSITNSLVRLSHIDTALSSGM